jgi:hypothetical protein
MTFLFISSSSEFLLAFGHTLCSMKDKLPPLYFQGFLKKSSHDGIAIKSEWLLQQQL